MLLIQVSSFCYFFFKLLVFVCCLSRLCLVSVEVLFKLSRFHLTRRVGRNVTLAIDHLIHVRLRIVTTAATVRPVRDHDCVTGNPGCATISTAGPCRVTCRGGSIMASLITSSQLEFQVLNGQRRPPGWAGRADVTDRSVPPSQKIILCDRSDPKCMHFSGLSRLFFSELYSVRNSNFENSEFYFCLSVQNFVVVLVSNKLIGKVMLAIHLRDWEHRSDSRS